MEPTQFDWIIKHFGMDPLMIAAMAVIITTEAGIAAKVVDALKTSLRARGVFPAEWFVKCLTFVLSVAFAIPIMLMSGATWPVVAASAAYSAWFGPWFHNAGKPQSQVDAQAAVVADGR